MISAINNSPNFTSSVPVRVMIDGKETFDKKLIKSACHKLTALLTQKPDPKNELIRRFAAFDPHYRESFHTPKTRPSDFFRCIIDRSRSFLVSGPQAKLLEQLGKEVSIQRLICEERRVADSFDLMVAKINYSRAINNITTSPLIRMKDRAQKPVTLDIHVGSNGKYGLTTFKLTQIKDIIFNT